MIEFLSQILRADSGVATRIPLADVVAMLGHAVLIGVGLMGLTGWVDREAEGRRVLKADRILALSTVLFLCVGMAAVMMLVNDNVARAFAVGAAIALVRFRIKVAGKFLSVAIFYAVLTGMACGVHRPDIAWTVTLLFGGLLWGLITLRKRLKRKRAAESEEAENVIPADLGKSQSGAEAG